jgi:hypothetical protein
MSGSLVIEFSGWCIIRLPTDPDPPDEPRGVSGYTFAFAGEPDFDRVIHLQPPDDFTPRSHGYEPLGVRVTGANRVVGADEEPVPALVKGTAELLGQPRFENRNWTLTLPGFEPINPFDLRIAAPGLEIRRSAPFDPTNPDMPLWEVPEPLLLAHGARGMEFEPQTVGAATGVWDQLGVAAQRLELLKVDLEKEKDPVAASALRGRIAELEIAVEFPTANKGTQDRRTMAHAFVERFAFPMLGTDAVVEGSPKHYLGSLDPTAPWMVSFWLGGWDPDLLCAYLAGSLQIPYSST